MTVWLCIINEFSWPTVRDNRLYGVPDSRARVKIYLTKPEDVLIFYCISPVKAIVGIYKVTSKVFEDRDPAPWEDRLYPYRIRIKPFSRELKELSKPIPLEAIAGKLSKVKHTRSMMGKSMIRLTTEDFNFIKSLIRGEEK